MIERHWKGIARPGEAANYEEHLLKETFLQLSAIKGFVKASILKRDVEKGTEFLIVTVWEDMQAIKQFAGKDASVAVVPANVQKMMVVYDATVAHYEIAAMY